MDALYYPQRPAMEVFDSSVFVVLQAICIDDPDDCLSGLTCGQVAIFLCKNNVVLSATITATAGSAPLTNVRERLQLGDTRLHAGDAALLFHALLNTILRGLASPLDALGDVLGDLERDILCRPERSLLQRVHSVKRTLGTLRSQAWPMRELLEALDGSGSPLLAGPVHAYFNVLYDHSVQIIDIIETYRDISTGLLQLFTNRMSGEVSRVVRYLTILQVLFLPAIFFAGIDEEGARVHCSQWFCVYVCMKAEREKERKKWRGRGVKEHMQIMLPYVVPLHV